ncbi:Dinitrogenase iron-molybdenum cofactor biosynthesis [Magnetococcus marinus MC-1]|uniref:Dinitrogenase iron-molybdenum cofactor biosynthesis n=2 Tax=Magnetococcus TaxID=162171 RepID=A0L6W1_MAGMM|nr:Dinitrogenase iron-molybdenum cofactor biosynthesis [Magnetococcus marinus MC-1]
MDQQNHEGLSVAFATADLNRVDQHFGTALKLALYRITPETAKLMEVVAFASEEMDGNEAKLPARLNALSGIQAVYCMAVGGSAARQLIAGGTTPIRLDESMRIETLISEIQHKMTHDPAPWMNWVKRKQDKEACDFEEVLNESWEE